MRPAAFVTASSSANILLSLWASTLAAVLHLIRCNCLCELFGGWRAGANVVTVSC
jgi:hypothetical protein